MGEPISGDLRRKIPSIDKLLAEPEFRRLAESYGRDLVTERLRTAVDELRRRIAETREDTLEGFDDHLDRWRQSVAADLDRDLGDGLRRVINATGILLHTNLGRAPLPATVAQALPDLLTAYCDLEFDLETGRRGERNRRAEKLLRALTGAEAALVVNNNAGALVLVLATVARGREVIVSRGELVEIGGSFRIPDILAAAGAALVEVGTTNRTRLSDYDRAVGKDTALLLKVNPSNYRLTGFVESVTATDLAALGRERGIPLLMDEGSGLLRPSDRPQLGDHPSMEELLTAGCDLVCGSGDKLVGGPQAGLLVGRAELVERCRRHPLYRALRPDRTVFAALEAVLRRHLAGEPMPLDRLWQEPAQARPRLQRLAAELGAEIIVAAAYVGGGAAPEQPIEGGVLALEGDSALLERLRLGSPAVVGYIRAGRLILDLRTVDPDDDPRLVEAVIAARRA